MRFCRPAAPSLPGRQHKIRLAFPCCQVYIIEANPRASRTVPFVAKAIGHPLAAYASLLMSGKTLAELSFTEVCMLGRGRPACVVLACERRFQPLPGFRCPLQEPKLNHVAVKEAVLPFDKFAGADTLLGPEMRSTGEVCGRARWWGVLWCVCECVWWWWWGGGGGGARGRANILSQVPLVSRASCTRNACAARRPALASFDIPHPGVAECRSWA